MTRICPNCNYENQDDYDFCAKCGTPLIEGVQPNNILVFSAQPRLNKKILLVSYLVTILLSWGGFIVNIVSKNSYFGIFTFFGFFLPFYLVQSPIKELRKHGFIQLIISIVGVALSLYVMFK
ncbi:MAG: zinc ribbon domain-containing protein [Methanobrevibacter sp.]|nr:zinc ribbon domain-containing protein [Methanobrevibacter sp.]